MVLRVNCERAASTMGGGRSQSEEPGKFELEITESKKLANQA